MKRIIFLFAFIASFFFTLAQDQELYNKLVNEAFNYYQQKEYQKSAQSYKAAFDALGGKATSTDRYNAACSYALTGETDSAFYHLFRLAQSSIKYNNYSHITTDKDLNALHKDKRWEELLEIVKANKEEAEKYLDKELVALLDTIFQEDQKYRKEIDEVLQKHGQDSEEFKVLLQKMEMADTENLVKVQQILDTRGWLGTDVIGSRGNMTLFLVIQHADLETQVKYLPMLREAVKKGKASASNLALLEDRVAIRQGGKQIYGSQIGMDKETGEYYVMQMIEPEKVNERRAEVGLGPLEEYISRWNIKWDAEAHKDKWK